MIEPALTPEEWRDRAYEWSDEEGDGGYVDAHAHILTVTPMIGGRGSREARPGMRDDQQCVDIPRPEAMLALANAALPDGSPYKITRADVEMLTEAITYLETVKDSGPLAAFRDKIAALLPPEGT